MEDYRAQFIDIYNKNVTRPGADRLLKWLEGTDFFTAPASTKFHGACECGLVMHSINVYNAMMQHFFTEEEDNPETFAVCALLHDVCKANFYKVSTRNVKNDATGQWEKVPFYQVADQLPYGHGEKSVYLIEHFMQSLQVFDAFRYPACLHLCSGLGIDIVDQGFHGEGKFFALGRQENQAVSAVGGAFFPYHPVFLFQIINQIGQASLVLCCFLSQGLLADALFVPQAVHYLQHLEGHIHVVAFEYPLNGLAECHPGS